MARNISNIKVKRKPKRDRAKAKTLDERYMGSEPDWGDTEPDQNMMHRAYGWYNYFHNAKQHAKTVRTFFKKDKAKTKLLNKLPDWKFTAGMSTVCHLHNNGCKVLKSSQDYFDEQIKGLLEEAKAIVETKAEKAKAKKPTLTIQERTKIIVNEKIGELEEIHDQMSESNYKMPFDMYEWLGKNDVKAGHVSAIKSSYVNLFEEVKEMVAGTDDQLNEGYSHLNASAKKRYLKFMTDFMADLDRFGDNTKKAKKTRAKKPVTLEKQVKGVKFKETDDEFKLASISPTEIIGAQALWVFDTKYRELGVYRAITPGPGLCIKGTTIEEWSSASEKKKLRKPEETLQTVLKGGKRDLKKLMDGLSTKGSAPRQRINNNMILLRLEK